jgi:fatty-acyl-CoA synthase
MVLADDAAMIERNQHGLQAGQPEWMIRRRGAHRRAFADDGSSTARITDDAGILGFWEHYRELMAAA